MNTTFRHRKPQPKSLTLQLLLISLNPILVNAQYSTVNASYTTPSWYVGLTFLLTSLLIFAVIFIFYLRQRCLRRLHHTSHRGGPAAGGLDAAAIKSFPVLTYKEARQFNIGVGLDCAVCLSAFQEDETLRLMPKCGHAFHPDCVDVWLASHTTCPYCRADLLLLPEDDDSPSTSASCAIKATRDEDGEANDVVVDLGSPLAGASAGAGGRD